MMTKFWTAALKYHAPLTIVGFIFFYLISRLIEMGELIDKHPWFAFSILFFVTNFCAYILNRSTNKISKSHESTVAIKNNKIVGNKVGGSLSVSSAHDDSKPLKISIEGNEVSKNTVDGDFVIGGNKDK